MIKEVDLDVFDAPIDVLLSGCNCHCTQGSGLAGQLRKYYPEAYEADLKTKPGDRLKLGDYTIASIVDLKGRRSKTIKYIVNCYSQYDFGTQKRQADYEAIYNVFEKVRNLYWNKGLTIGIPYKFAAGLAGGNWAIVETMIKEIFKDANFDVLICRRPGD